MSVVLALTAAALACWPDAGGTTARLRMRWLLSAMGAESGPQSPAARVRGWIERRSNLGPLVAGLAVAAALGSPAGVVVGAFAALVVRRVSRRLSARAQARSRLELAWAAPPVLDLLVSALRAGLPLSRAAEIVAEAEAGRLSDDLRRVAASARLGATDGSEWDDYRDDPIWGPVARAARRSAASGSALATAIERIADDVREDQDQRAHAAAQRATILVMGPLGICFLPAFICVGIVPVIVGLLSGVLG
jgi:pilus assembly protein TadC